VVLRRKVGSWHSLGVGRRMLTLGVGLGFVGDVEVDIVSTLYFGEDLILSLAGYGCI
jgi:hypothetical protein